MDVFEVLILVAAAAAPIVELGEREEFDLALSAAPDHLKERAGVYRLTDGGYELVRPSTNGFNCLVAREANSGIGPLCFDREGSETTLKALILQGRLMREGKSAEDIDRLVDAAYRRGELIAPRKPGISYMLSNHFRQVSPKTGKDECIFPPHVMLYAPYLKNSDIGAEDSRGSTHLPWILNEGKPNAYILVVPHGTDVNSCR